MDYFLLKGPKSEQLRATDLARPFEYSPCPSVVTHNKIQRANDLRLEVKHSEHNETMIWSYGGYLTVHSSLTKGMRDAGLTGFQLRPTTVQFRDGELSQDYSELIVTGWAGIARPESGIKLIESCSGCFRKKYSALEDADQLIDWEQWSEEDFFIVWPLVKFILITARAAEFLKDSKVRSFTLHKLQSIEVRNLPDLQKGGAGFGVSQLSAFMPRDKAIEYGRPLGLE